MSNEIKNSESTKSSNSTTSTDSLKIDLTVQTAPTFPNSIFEKLPKYIAEPCSLIESQYQRDMFLTSALPVFASHMPNVCISHKDGKYSPDLFTVIVAAPATGKGIITKSQKLGRVLQNDFEEKYQVRRQAYELLPEKEKKSQQGPKKSTLFIPANSSSRAILDTLKVNGGAGLLFETEIDTLINADKQDWGNFTDIIRKAFHHEPISINRKDNNFYIERPKLSICLSGTFDQFLKMFGSAANGHFSRYAFYTHTGVRKWQSHRPTKNSDKLDNYIHQASNDLFQLYQKLQARDEPLVISLSDGQWNIIDHHFSKWMSLIDDLSVQEYFHATNNRMPIIMLRIVTILTVLRQYETSSNSLIKNTIEPSNVDIESALSIADIYLRHGLRLFNSMISQRDSSKGERFDNFYSMLPNEFKTKDALKVANQLEIPESTVKKWLPKHFDKIMHGQYCKRPI